MASDIRRARVVSINKLSATIDKAIASAVRRYDIGASKPNLLGGGDLIGRVLRERDVASAFKFAEDVTAKVNKLKGVAGVPVVSKVAGGIFVGFIERSQNLRQLGGGGR